jgi:hypothetical protein
MNISVALDEVNNPHDFIEFHSMLRQLPLVSVSTGRNTISTKMLYEVVQPCSADPMKK